jgi:hypothetical protein
LIDEEEKESYSLLEGCEENTLGGNDGCGVEGGGWREEEEERGERKEM